MLLTMTDEPTEQYSEPEPEPQDTSSEGEQGAETETTMDDVAP